MGSGVISNYIHNFQVLCTIHGAVAKRVCQQHGEVRRFICVYCTHRNHKGHQLEPIDQCAADWRLEINNHAATYSNVQTSLKNSVHESKQARATLEATLKSRKLRCIENYVTQLEKEEETLLKAFDKRTQSNKSHISSVLGKLKFSKDESLGVVEVNDSLFLMNRHFQSRRPMPNIKRKIVSLLESKFSPELGMIFDTENRFENEGTIKFEIPHEVVDEADVRDMLVTFAQKYSDGRFDSIVPLRINKCYPLGRL